MNGESGIQNPESRARRTDAALWLIRLGALFIASLAPLEYQLNQLWMPDAVDLFQGKATFTMSTSYEVFYYRDTGMRLIVLLAFVLPSFLITIVAAGPRFHRFLLVAFLPLSALACALAREVAPAMPYLAVRAMEVPSWLASLLPAAGAVGVVIAYVVGVPSSTLAPIARRLLAADILWIILLEWNTTNFAARYVPGWVGVAGAAMILLGDPAPPRARDS